MEEELECSARLNINCKKWRSVVQGSMLTEMEEECSAGLNVNCKKWRSVVQGSMLTVPNGGGV